MFIGRLDPKNELLTFPPDTNIYSKFSYMKVCHALRSIVSKTDFEPSLIHTKLNLIRSRTIGLMIQNPANAFFTEILRGIESVAVKSGFSLFVCPKYQSIDKESCFIDDLIKRKTGGLIVLSTPCFKTKELREACSAMRLVSIQSDIKGVDNITVTDEQGMFEATEHLVKLGHTRIAFIGYDSSVSSLNNRLIGFKAAHRKYNLPIDYSIIFKEHLTSSGYITAKALLQSKNPPTAIQCVNDHLAMGVYMAASELAIKIPQQISVSGFDNTLMSRIMTPNLTTVSQPTAAMGETAAQIIIKRIIGDERNGPKNIVLPTNHIIRDSTAKACR